MFVLTANISLNYRNEIGMQRAVWKTFKFGIGTLQSFGLCLTDHILKLDKHWVIKVCRLMYKCQH